MIKPGLRLFIDNPSDKLSVVTGAELCTTSDYEKGAYVPKQNWRKLTSSEEENLFDYDKDLQSNFYIKVWRLPQEIVDHFSVISTSIKNFNNESFVTNLYEHPNYRRGIRKLIEMIDEVSDDTSRRILGHYHRQPGLLSTSVSVDNLFVGLHIDGWGEKETAKRSGYPNRLCVNLGPERRYFQFVNYTIPQMLNEKKYKILSDQPNLIVSEFLKNNAHYPIIRLAVDPGEAYIAPTEGIIHDATTVGKVYVDCTVTVLGNYSLEFAEKIAAYSA